MSLQSIRVSVSAEAASAYSSAPDKKRKLISEIVNTLLNPAARVSLAEFRKIAKRANQEAVDNGLTEQKLSDILDE